VHLITGLATVTFATIINSQTEIDDRVVLFKQALDGIAFLHQNGIIHRDIKPANLLVKSLDPVDMAIGDFGCAIQQERVPYDSPGTIPYLAPEQVKGQNHEKSVDIWALALVVTELFGHPRSREQVSWEQYKSLHRWLEGSDSREFPIVELVASMLQWEAEERPRAHDALNHHSIVGYPVSNAPREKTDSPSGKKRRL
jgi:serine/threonine protein kinase